VFGASSRSWGTCPSLLNSPSESIEARMGVVVSHSRSKATHIFDCSCNWLSHCLTQTTFCCMTGPAAAGAPRRAAISSHGTRGHCQGHQLFGIGPGQARCCPPNTQVNLTSQETLRRWPKSEPFIREHPFRSPVQRDSLITPGTHPHSLIRHETTTETTIYISHLTPGPSFTTALGA